MIDQNQDKLSKLDQIVNDMIINEEKPEDVEFIINEYLGREGIKTETSKSIISRRLEAIVFNMKSDNAPQEDIDFINRDFSETYGLDVGINNVSIKKSTETITPEIIPPPKKKRAYGIGWGNWRFGIYRVDS